MSTIRYISEQVSRLYARAVDKENNNTVLNWKEVKPIVSQEVNNMIQATLINLNEMDVGVNITSGMIGRYKQTVLTRGSGADQEWYVKLPVYPIRLKNSLGIYRVGPANKKFSPPYIIVPEIYWDLVSEFDEGGLEGEIGVIPSGDNELIFSEDPGVSQVELSLVVNDTDKFGDNDELPVPSDMEARIIKTVLGYFLPENKEDKGLDVVTPEQPVVK